MTDPASEKILTDPLAHLIRTYIDDRFHARAGGLIQDREWLAELSVGLANQVRFATGLPALFEETAALPPESASTGQAGRDAGPADLIAEMAAKTGIPVDRIVFHDDPCGHAERPENPCICDDAAERINSLPTVTGTLRDMGISVGDIDPAAVRRAFFGGDPQ